MRRTGLAPGTEDERDPGQVRLAIEAIRALLPLLEQAAPEQTGAIRDALRSCSSRYVRIGGQPPGAETAGKRCGGRVQRRRAGAGPGPGVRPRAQR